MASHYDEKKKCRVGTMDEAQFYGEADKSNGAFFKGVLKAWGRAGGTVKWGAGGAGLRGAAAGKEVGIGFLAPAYAGKKDRIELSFTNLAKQIGSDRSEALKAALAKTAGERFKGKSMVSIVDPGGLQSAGQTSLAKALCKVLD
jgi:hypothetical protein